MPEWVYLAIIALETTVIGFFVRHHWNKYVSYDDRITVLEKDKAIREEKTP